MRESVGCNKGFRRGGRTAGSIAESDYARREDGRIRCDCRLTRPSRPQHLDPRSAERAGQTLSALRGCFGWRRCCRAAKNFCDRSDRPRFPLTKKCPESAHARLRSATRPSTPYRKWPRPRRSASSRCSKRGSSSARRKRKSKRLLTPPRPPWTCRATKSKNSAYRRMASRKSAAFGSRHGRR